MSPAAKGGFDRVRPRVPKASRRPQVGQVGQVGQVDVEGKRALFSAEPPVPALGSVTVACGGCRRTSVLGPSQALRAMLPSLHLPLLRHNRSYLRCPACSRWEWCHVSVRV